MADILRPLFDHVVIKELDPERMRKLGCSSRRAPTIAAQRGHRLAIGDGPPDLPDFKMPVKPGHHVVFRARRGSGSRSTTSASWSAACARSSGVIEAES